MATRPPGYVLDVTEESVDVGRFRHMSAEGRRAMAAGDPNRAATQLREALALWRGEALADFAYEEFARAEITQLTEERLTVLEERVDAELACGRHADLVPELEAAVMASPFRERLRCQLMLALYRSGRQADALRQYQEARKALGRSSARTWTGAPLLRDGNPGSQPIARRGRPPGKGTAADNGPRPSERAVDDIAPASTLVGRDQPLARLGAALRRAEEGSRSVVLVSGESGIGKTELGAPSHGAGPCWPGALALTMRLLVASGPGPAAQSS